MDWIAFLILATRPQDQKTVWSAQDDAGGQEKQLQKSMHEAWVGEK